MLVWMYFCATGAWSCASLTLTCPLLTIVKKKEAIYPETILSSTIVRMDIRLMNTLLELVKVPS